MSDSTLDPRLETLSDREREILVLIADGLRTGQIARRLHISTKTVDTHRRNVMRKTDLDSIARLTKLAVRAGWSRLDAPSA